MADEAFMNAFFEEIIEGMADEAFISPISEVNMEAMAPDETIMNPNVEVNMEAMAAETVTNPIVEVNMEAMADETVTNPIVEVNMEAMADETVMANPIGEVNMEAMADETVTKPIVEVNMEAMADETVMANPIGEVNMEAMAAETVMADPIGEVNMEAMAAETVTNPIVEVNMEAMADEIVTNPMAEVNMEAMAAETIINPIVEVNIKEAPQALKSSFCHQCRQKRSDAVGSCVIQKGSKTCAVKICPKCLTNRYGEDATEVAAKVDWVCPKCRGICNCSLCMKKEGKRPTGILAPRARKTGCSSVTDFLKLEGSDKFYYKRKTKPADAVERNAVGAICSKVNAVEGNDVGASCSEENAVERMSKIPRTKPVPKERKKRQVEEVKLPQGNDSITVSGIDLPPGDAGDVLQFLKFCSTFGKVINLREGQAQLVVREMLSGRSTRSQEHSMLIRTMIQLLTLIFVDRGETSDGLSATDDSWFTSLGKCFAESEVELDDFPLEMFEKGIGAYEEMDTSKRIKLLNFVCDETLGTRKLREFIENPESFEKKKEAKEKLKAAEAKEKELNQKIQAEFAKAEEENNGVKLTYQEKLAIMSQMEAESDQVCAEMINALEMKKSLEYDDALRTIPVELDENGLILWKLNSYKEEKRLYLQDIGSWGDVCPHEKWFAFSPEQKPQVKKYFADKRKKILLEKRKQKKEQKEKAVLESE